MTNHVSTLNVLLYGEPIATITNVGNDRTLFAFMDSYINDESRPVLGLGFKDSLGGLLTSFKPTQTKLTPFFSNLLPEETMRNYLAERAGVNPAREFFLLWVLGQDLAGAITVEPADGEALPPNVYQDIEDETKTDGPMRFSLAGVQLKFSAVQQAYVRIPAIPDTDTVLIRTVFSFCFLCSYFYFNCPVCSSFLIDSPLNSIR